MGLREAKNLRYRPLAHLGLTHVGQAWHLLDPAPHPKLSIFQGGLEAQRGKVPAQGHTAQADVERRGVWGLEDREPMALRDPSSSSWNPGMPILSAGQLGSGG